MKPPVSDWANHPHEVVGSDPDQAHYRRRLPDGQWQWWFHLDGEWINETADALSTEEETS